MGGLMAGAIGALEKRTGGRMGGACSGLGSATLSTHGVSMVEWQISQAEQPPPACSPCAARAGHGVASDAASVQG